MFPCQDQNEEKRSLRCVVKSVNETRAGSGVVKGSVSFVTCQDVLWYFQDQDSANKFLGKFCRCEGNVVSTKWRFQVILVQCLLSWLCCMTVCGDLCQKNPVQIIMSPDPTPCFELPSVINWNGINFVSFFQQRKRPGEIYGVPCQTQLWTLGTYFSFPKDSSDCHISYPVSINIPFPRGVRS